MRYGRPKGRRIRIISSFAHIMNNIHRDVSDLRKANLRDRPILNQLHSFLLYPLSESPTGTFVIGAESIISYHFCDSMRRLGVDGLTSHDKWNMIA